MRSPRGMTDRAASDPLDSFPATTSPQEVIVIGAGIIGLSVALHLQRRGHRVRVFDGAGPGTGASGGNAGVLSTAAVNPLAMPDTLLAVPRMLLDPDAALKLSWSHMPALVPWLLRFAAASRPARVEAASQALAGLLKFALPAYRPVVDVAGVADLVRPGGYYEVYESAAGYDGAAAKEVLRARRGVAVEELDGAGLRRLEPALGPTILRGVRLVDSAFCPNPLRLVHAIAGAFERAGGVIERRRVVGFAGFGADGPRQALTDDGPVLAARFVLAAGAHSGDLALRLGSPVPLTGQRGYHAMIDAPGVTLTRPVAAGEAHMVMTSMKAGLCLTGTLELTGLNAPPRWAFARAMLDHARRLLPGLRIDRVSYWMGYRPGMADSLPVIGRAPRAANTIFAFGHGALGLTLGAITGRIVADLVDDRPGLIDLKPFRPDRF